MARGLRIVARLAPAVLAALSLLAGSAAAARQHPKVAPTERWEQADRDEDGDVRVVVILREGAAAERAAGQPSRKVPGRVRRSFRRIAGDVIKVPPERLAEVVAELEADPDVVAAAPDRRDQRALPQSTPWGVEHVHADPVSRGTRSGAGVKVAVIDSGIWAAAGGAVHPDLAGAYRGGYDFVNDDPYPWDDFGHGTHVAGILAAADNTYGVVGVAPGVSLYALKVLDADGYGYYSDFIAALDWCIEQGVRIVNYSAGGREPWGPVEAACERARAAGITIVAAAGNDGGPLLYPAGYQSVIAVGSIGKTDQRSYFSNIGGELDLVAPGESIRSTFSGGGYAFMTGTSMATPHVAGAAALLAGRGISDPQLVQEHLQATALDLGDPGHDARLGHGLVDAAATLPAEPRLLAPLGGETVPSGAPFQVAWNPVPGAATYRVLFARSAAHDWSEIAASTAATAALWDAPVVGAALTKGRLQVAAYDAGGRLLSVGTRAGFSIRSLRITSPAPGASVTGGAQIWLSWEVFATPRPVVTIDVELSEDGGKTWSPLKKLGRLARNFRWQSPAVAAVRPQRLRVVLRDAGGIAISSDAVSFSLAPAGP